MTIRVIAEALRAALLCCCVTVLACQTKPKEPPKPPPDITGLAAVPAVAKVVVGANVGAIVDSWLVDRALAQMFARDPGLKMQIEQMLSECQLDPAKDVRTIVIGLGQGAAADQAVMVVTGQFSEVHIARCVGKILAADNDVLTTSVVEGRTFYHAKRRSGRDQWFAFGDPETLIVATSSEWLRLATGTGTKISSAHPLAAWLKKAKPESGLWGVGLIDERTGADLVELTGGQVTTAPRAMFGHTGVESGLELELAAVMNSPDDAKSLFSMAKAQITMATLALHGRGLSELVSKITVENQDDTVYLRSSLSEDELKQLLAQIDTTARSEQTHPPAAGDGDQKDAADAKSPDATQ